MGKIQEAGRRGLQSFIPHYKERENDGREELSKNIESNHDGDYYNHRDIKNWVHGVLLNKIKWNT